MPLVRQRNDSGFEASPRRAALPAAARPDEEAAGEEVPAAETELGALTEREREVLELLSNGHNTRSIAEHLYISPVTVKHHVQHILGKLGVHRRVDEILAWIRGSRRPGGKTPASPRSAARAESNPGTERLI